MVWWILQQLKSKNAGTRQKAAIKLAAVPVPVALATILQALPDSDPETRQLLAEVLGQLKDPKTVPPLCTLLLDRTPAVRRAAADALKTVGEASATPSLVGALRDDDAGVRSRAATALEKLHWQPANEKEEALDAVARGDMEKAAQLGAVAIEALAAAAAGDAYDLRVSAVKAFGQIGGERIFKHLLTALRAEDPAVRIAAIGALSETEASRAIDPLLLLLRDGNPRVRACAVDALNKISHASVVEPMTQMLEDAAWDVRLGAARALGRIKDPRAVEGLIKRLKDPDNDVRETVAGALGQIGDPRAVTGLILAMTDSETPVRNAAEAALRGIEPAWPPTPAAQAAIPELRAALKHKDYWVRQAAGDVLARIGGERISTSQQKSFTTAAHPERRTITEILIETVSDPDRDFRLAAIEALGRMEDHGAHDALALAIDDTDPWLGAAAAKALEALHNQRSAPE